jgi:hypothetical protein
MKVLFLDIDGVLNSARTAVACRGYPMDLDGYHRAMFDEVALGLTTASVILTSNQKAKRRGTCTKSFATGWRGTLPKLMATQAREKQARQRGL